jgi:hypothetical protein
MAEDWKKVLKDFPMDALRMIIEWGIFIGIIALFVYLFGD